MANIFRSGDNQDLFEYSDLQGSNGMLMHLATLELEEKTYLALGSVHPMAQGAQVSVIMVQEKQEENGQTRYEIVHNRRELSEIVPRLMEALVPGAEINMSNMSAIEAYEDEEDEDMLPYIFDYSGNDKFIS